MLKVHRMDLRMNGQTNKQKSLVEILRDIWKSNFNKILDGENREGNRDRKGQKGKLVGWKLSKLTHTIDRHQPRSCEIQGE